jgi:hypothetical protein
MTASVTITVYHAIAHFRQAHGCGPSYHEIQRLVPRLKSPQAVRFHVMKLVGAGLLEMRKGSPRTMVVLKNVCPTCRRPYEAGKKGRAQRCL